MRWKWLGVNGIRDTAGRVEAKCKHDCGDRRQYYCMSALIKATSAPIWWHTSKISKWEDWQELCPNSGSGSHNYRFLDQMCYDKLTSQTHFKWTLKRSWEKQPVCAWMTSVMSAALSSLNTFVWMIMRDERCQLMSGTVMWLHSGSQQWLITSNEVLDQWESTQAK